MKTEHQISPCNNLNHQKKWNSNSFSRLFRYASRLILVCFGFTLRSNFAPDSLDPRSFLAQPFQQVTKYKFNINRQKFLVSILNYRARPPRCCKVHSAFRHSISVCAFSNIFKIIKTV